MLPELGTGRALFYRRGSVISFLEELSRAYIKYYLGIS